MDGLNDKIIKKKYAVWAIFNFVVLAVAGVVLRMMHCFSLPGINYQFLMHSHSHFAFAGWMFLAIILLLFYQFKTENELLQKRFHLVFLLTLLVSFGMLVSFFLTGYSSVSIIISTIFIVVGYYFVYVVFRGKTFKNSTSISTILLKSALIFLLLSSLGPYSLGYLKASGFAGSLQQNAIYFYLHFQLNGFMELALLGMFLKFSLKPNNAENKQTTFWTKVLTGSTLPLYTMFILWVKPATWVYVLVFIAAISHFIAWVILVYKIKTGLTPLSFLAKTAFIAISLQFFFQILVGIPAIGNWAFGNRNLIIGYIHLLTLGSFSPLIIDLFTKAGFLNPWPKLNYLFIATTVSYLILLFGSAFLALFQIYIQNLELYLLATNITLLLIGIGYFINIISCKKSKTGLNLG